MDQTSNKPVSNEPGSHGVADDRDLHQERPTPQHPREDSSMQQPLQRVREAVAALEDLIERARALSDETQSDEEVRRNR